MLGKYNPVFSSFIIAFGTVDAAAINTPFVRLSMQEKRSCNYRKHITSCI